MPSMSSLLEQLQLDYPQWQFEAGDHFAWLSGDQSIAYNPAENPAYLLHEVAHGLLDHQGYERDIDLLKMERDAWDAALDKLSPLYEVPISEDLIQDNLDTYRDWLHARSLCPNCSSVGYQVKQSTYTCPACQGKWRVNEARTCGLRRYKT